MIFVPYKDIEKRKEYLKKYRIKHLEQLREKDKKYSFNHKEKRNVYHKKYAQRKEVKIKRKEYERKFYRKLKHWAVDKLGRKCAECGLVSEFDCVYDFHHINKNGKNWNSKSSIRNKTLNLWQNENKIPDEIILLCANCHRIKHYKELLA